jgi:hypothetical protein
MMTPEAIDVLRWLALGLLFVILGVVVFLFIRKGSRIKADPENKPDKPEQWGGG